MQLCKYFELKARIISCRSLILFMLMTGSNNNQHAIMPIKMMGKHDGEKKLLDIKITEDRWLGVWTIQ